MLPNMRRRYLHVGARRVHYLRAGEGPPAVLIHSSPANAFLLQPEIDYLSRRHTIFTFDTPGFGLSQPLPSQHITVADLADSLAETLDAIAMPPCPVFGTHTGAAIALELAVRHPARVTGVVLDGVPAFTDAESCALFGDYFRKIPVTDLGGQYAAVWTRFRDQSIWFPWSNRQPENLNGYDLGTKESTHLWASMYHVAADTYEPAYRAALLHYGPRALVAAAALDVPAIYTATDTDMLFGHMARLPPLKPGQEIRHIGTSYEAKRALIAAGFARFGGASVAPPDRDAIESSDEVSRQFVDAADGRQIHLRHAGRVGSDAVLLLHDAPGSALALEDLVSALGRTAFVLAPDLPGCGLSSRFSGQPPSIADYADDVAALLDRLGIADVAVHGIGFGASVAIELANRFPDRVRKLSLCGVLLPEADERAWLSSHYAPPIAIEADGAHWYRTWLMLRDSLVWWPWFDRRRAAQRSAPADFGAERLHCWTLDVMGSRESYADLIHAALSHDAQRALTRLSAQPDLLLGGTATPLAAYDDRLAALLPNARRIGALEDAFLC
jgi:pimeloyl-ACP methyl ester carboxylesterase